jgi:hypothetical protein
MRYALAVLILLTLGCNQSSNYKLTALGKPADFSVLINQFNSDLAKMGKPPLASDIQFYSFDAESKTGYVLHGFCSRTPDGKKAISLSADPNDLTVTDYIYFVHEIGHCAYGKGHDDSSINIMNTIKNANMRSMFLDEVTRLSLIREMLDN